VIVSSGNRNQATRWHVYPENLKQSFTRIAGDDQANPLVAERDAVAQVYVVGTCHSNELKLPPVKIIDPESGRSLVGTDYQT
jgi:hypothetical protein